MKTRITVILLLLIATCCTLQANELGKRYLKLGNTYRESGNFEKAEEYLKQGRKMVATDIYWTATADEFMGYLYRDMVASGNYNDNSDFFSALSKENMEKALTGFQKAVKQTDGSPSALDNAREQIKEISSMLSKGDDLPSSRPSKSASINYSNTKIVNIDNARVKEVPNDLPSSLENFSAVNNRIKDFTSQLSPYKNLKFLNLKKNRIVSLENGLDRYKKLRVLNLANNKLKTIPSSIADIKQLEVLDLSKNKLKEIPNSITSLKNLRVLDISGNKIQFSQISTLLKNMPNTNIVFDVYELVDDQVDSIDEDGDGPIQGK